MKKTSDYRKELYREMQALRSGKASIGEAKAMAALGNAITQSIIAEAQVLRIKANDKSVTLLGDLEIMGTEEK